MNKQQLFENIKKKQSFLCVDLTLILRRFLEHLMKKIEDPIFAFNKAIIECNFSLLYCLQT